MSGDVETTIAALREAALTLRSVTISAADEVRALAVARNAIDAAMCERLDHMDVTKEHESEGASSISTWARRELNQDAGRTRQMVRASKAFRDLPRVGAAARSGGIASGHVEAFVFGLKHVGVEEIRALEEPLVDIAQHVAPGDMFAKVREIRAVVHADDLDEAWLKGMDKRDIRLARTSEGWHVTGFLDIATGAKFDAILKNLSVPRDADDDRIPSQRRMDALDNVCTRVLEHGLPADNGVRPHIAVTVEAEALKAMAETDARDTLGLDARPTVLQGFGPIGPKLLAYLLCGAELTPFLIRTIGKNTEVLDVGRTERLATPRQTKAVSLRQGGVCAARGCKHPIAHVHHNRWWSAGGTTDLDNLTGLCRKCHTLVHDGRLDLARGSPHAA